MIEVWAGPAGSWCFGVAFHGDRLVATAIGATPDEALGAVLRCLPRGRPHRPALAGAAFPAAVAAMLARLEAGEPPGRDVALCPDCVHEPLASVYRAASRIPRGYATTYGRIAAAAGTEARVVGNAMAGNPLYPLVPCHRVVGADLSLVGYTGRQDAEALRRKLDRLRAEARGADGEREIAEAGGLVVVPVEWVIRRAVQDGVADRSVQLELW